MLAIFGWLVLVVVGLKFLALWILLGFFGSMGKWTIGGAHNSVGTRISAGIAGLLVALYWYWLYTICPFTVTIN